MKLRDMQYKGNFEEGEIVAETLQVVQPENELEEAEIAWSLLRHPETVTDDSARRDYVFHYEVVDHLGDGVFRLVLNARDQSGEAWSAEIAAALVTTATPSEQRAYGFAPFWFISRDVHFKTEDERIGSNYAGEAFGKLDFERIEALPHRRLFGAMTAART